MSPEFHAVCPESDLVDDQIKLVEVDQRLVILYRHDGAYYCVDDICTHDGGTLSDGAVAGCEIICPRHGARFDLRDGKALTMPATRDTLAHQVKIIEGNICVKLTED